MGRRQAAKHENGGSDMKRKKLIIGSVLLMLLVVGLGITYLVRKHRVEVWRREGIAASINGEHARASDLLIRYLQRHRPTGSVQDEKDYTDALTHYITSRELAELPNGQHFAETTAALKLLLGRDPGRLEDRRHLLELYVKLERRPEALDVANAILADKSPPLWRNDVRTLELKTDILTKLRQDREALLTAERWTEVAPLDFKPHMARFTLHALIGHSGESIIAAAKDLGKSASTDLPTKQKRPRFEQDDPRFELLQAYANSLAADAAGDANAAETFRKQAQTWLKAAASHPALTPELVQSLVTQFDHLGMGADAIAMLERLVKDGAGPDVRYALARRLWQQGKWEQVVTALADLNLNDIKSPPDATLVAFKAIALTNLGKAPDAAACREALVARNGQAAARAWTQLLHRIIDAGSADDKQVVTDCRAALLNDPRNSYLAYFLGDAQARLGEIDHAIGAWRAAVDLNPTWDAPAGRLVEALLQKNQPEMAQMVASAAAKHNQTAAAAIAMARAYAANMETGGAAEADQLFSLVSQIQSALPGEEQTLLIQIQLLARKGKKDEAAKAARAAIARTPTPNERFLLSVAITSRRFTLGLEEECFVISEKAHGLTARLAYARAADQFLSGSADTALKKFDDVARRSGHGQEVPWQLARAQFLDVTGNSAAKAAWVALAEANPKDLSVQQAAVAARAVQGDWDFMQPAIERLRTLTTLTTDKGDKGDQGAPVWRMAKARLMVESPRNTSDCEQGSVLLNDILKYEPQKAEAHVLLAKALVQMNRVDGAIEHLSLAAKYDPFSVPTGLMLAGLLQSRGDFDRVRQELDHITPLLHSADNRRQAAMLLTHQGETEKALQLLETGPRQAGPAAQPTDDLLLVTLYNRNHQTEKAEATLKRLLEKPDLRTIRFAIPYYYSQGRSADAEQALAKLDSLTLDPGIKELMWGSYYARAGNLAEAIKHYRSATEQAPTNPTGWRILAEYQSAMGKTADALATVEQALIALPGDKGFAAIKAKSKLLRDAGDDPQLQPVAVFVFHDPLNSDTTVELLGILQESHASNDMERLASKLQQLTEVHPDFLLAQIELVQCLWSMGRPNDAMAVAQRSMNAFPLNPEPARVAVQLCANAGKWQEMESAARAWKSRLPDDPMPAEIAIAQAQVSQKQYSAALSQIQPYLPAVQANPDHHADLLTLHCIASVNSGQSSAAKELLWPLTAKSAPWRLRWMQVALEIPSTIEAVAWLDQVSAIIPTDAIGERVGLAEMYTLLGERRKEQALIDKSTSLFGKIAQDPKVDATALMAAGAQAERHNDVKSAEAFYRRAVAMDKGLWIANNNLAMLLTRASGGKSEAVAFATAAVQAQPRMATVRDTLAEAQAAAGNHKAAADAERLAIRLDPDNLKWRVRLAQYLMKGGDPIEAKKIVQSLDASNPGDVQKLPPADKESLKTLRNSFKKA
jgi:tetratricopeptide (TPR) repeat protein